MTSGSAVILACEKSKTDGGMDDGWKEEERRVVSLIEWRSLDDELSEKRAGAACDID